jgi:hypothetical protein
MTHADASRFIVRKGAVQNTWMVWDRKARSPAKFQGDFAAGLSHERALQIWEYLTLYYGCQTELALRGHPPRGRAEGEGKTE